MILLWSDRIDADATDIINVQDTITQEICDGLRLELTSDEKDRLEQQKTANAEAYEEYLRGRDSPGPIHLSHDRAQRHRRSDRAFRARFGNGSFVRSGAQRAGAAYANRVMKGFGEPDDHAPAREAFDKALALDPICWKRA